MSRIIKRHIGYITTIIQEDNSRHNYIAIINQMSNDQFEVHMHEKFEDGSLSKDQMPMGSYAYSLASAKKMLWQDTGYKSKDFVWETEDW